jgi:hypothetical protein
MRRMRNEFAGELHIRCTAILANSNWETRKGKI